MYECPKQGECGFGWDKPTSCKHGPWIRTSTAAAPSSAPMRIKMPTELIAKLLGISSQPTPPAPENWWLRVVGPRESVRQAYATHRAEVAAAKRQRRTMPLGPCVVDGDGVPRTAGEFFNP